MAVFRISEDYDSDSDCSDAENSLYRKGVKKIAKKLQLSDIFVTNDDGKIALAAASTVLSAK